MIKAPIQLQDLRRRLYVKAKAAPLGPITLDVKRAGTRSAGNPPATCDAAGAGNGALANFRSYRASPRPYHPRLWDIFENGDSKQWEAVREEIHREYCEENATRHLSRLEELESTSGESLVAWVLEECIPPTAADPVIYDRPTVVHNRPILLSATNSELNSLIQSSNEIQVETDKSKFRRLFVEEHHMHRGFIRIVTSQDELGFEFPDSKPDTVGWEYLQHVASKIRAIAKLRK